MPLAFQYVDLKIGLEEEKIVREQFFYFKVSVKASDGCSGSL